MVSEIHVVNRKSRLLKHCEIVVQKNINEEENRNLSRVGVLKSMS